MSEQGETFSRGFSGEAFEAPDGRLDLGVFDDMLEWLRTKKASDITLTSGNYVWAEIGGQQVRVSRKQITHPEVSGILREMYGDNGPGMVNAGTPVDFAYEVRRKGGRMRFRVNATSNRMPGGRGFSLTLRNLPVQPLLVEELGLEEEILANLRPPQGMNLFTGPTGSGKSTMVSSLLRWHLEKTGVNEKVVEYSRPVEYVYDGLVFPDSHVIQMEAGDHVRPSETDREEGGGIWSRCVSDALRKAPKIIVIGEARDRATIEGCIEAALTGHLLMSTMHTIGVPATIRRAMMPFPGPERRGIAMDLLECMNMMVTQLLLPRVGGGKVGCREFLVVDRKVRSALGGLDTEEWPGKLTEMLSGRQVTGRSMADSAKDLLARKLITPETFEWIAVRTSGESKVVRQARSGGLAGGLAGLALGDDGEEG